MIKPEAKVSQRGKGNVNCFARDLSVSDDGRNRTRSCSEWVSACKHAMQLELDLQGNEKGHTEFGFGSLVSHARKREKLSSCDTPHTLGRWQKSNSRTCSKRSCRLEFSVFSNIVQILNRTDPFRRL
ncbi:hypothetical protein AN958_00412 [Leucoagaricus sp. SymC.cos]|nr:hypothetical protein AN958_00412 [Leucoagaricus sp. SymC.cos]